MKELLKFLQCNLCLTSYTKLKLPCLLQGSLQFVLIQVLGSQTAKYEQWLEWLKIYLAVQKILSQDKQLWSENICPQQNFLVHYDMPLNLNRCKSCYNSKLFQESSH